MNRYHAHLLDRFSPGLLFDIDTTLVLQLVERMGRMVEAESAG